MMQDDTYQTIQIFLAGRNLKDLDFFSKSDPYVKVSYRRDFHCKNYTLVGKTQTIKDNLNPTFTKSFVIDYVFQSRQDIKFEVFDDDGGEDDYVGGSETTVGALMGEKNQTSILELKKEGKGMGKLIIRCEKVGASGAWYEMKWKALKLMNTDSFFDFWDKSDPYLKFLKVRGDNSLIEAFRTDVIKDNLNPSWKSFQIQASRLHSDNSSRFKVECWDWEASGKDQFIGQQYLDVWKLKESHFPMQVALKNPKSNKPGRLVLENFRSFQKPTFVDYLRGGLELNMMIAIDFTASNGMPKFPNSLHYMDPAKPNQYQIAIDAISQILLNYDSDKKIPAFGFGAKPHFPNLNSPTASHCFPLSGDFSQLDSLGSAHLMELYSKALMSVQLAGPTFFAPLIEQVAKLSYQCQQSQAYTYQTLLILTDGEIHDMDATKNLIVKSTTLPLSIIIVGVGNADFTNMEALDGDHGLFDSHGRKAERDIVQFVPFREVQYNPDLLAKQLLAELPNQVVQYFMAMGVQPRAPNQQNIEQMYSENPQQNAQNQVASMFNEAKFFAQEPNQNPYGSS